eukprot:1144141-Pelagomonas_calceolata.AAC.3
MQTCAAFAAHDPHPPQGEHPNGLEMPHKKRANEGAASKQEASGGFSPRQLSALRRLEVEGQGGQQLTPPWCCILGAWTS